MKKLLSAWVYTSEKDLSIKSGLFISGIRGKKDSSNGQIPTPPPLPPNPPILDCSINLFVDNDYICDYFV
jgi:hypothetical protein